ncbi:MAG TPA: hypothetical protein HA362_00410 [Nanoarchaeota archaeon]|nr:hypothetical protein [Nanoarchaeota archaeon]
MVSILEVMACHRIKDPVRFYLHTTSEGEYEFHAREFAETVARRLMETRRAYLATVSAFADDGRVISTKETSDGGQAHERWHNYVQENKLESDAGDFIEEASAAVIESVTDGYGDKYLEPSKRFLQLHLLVQRSSGEELEKILEKFFVGDKELVYEADKIIMGDSCPWLSYLAEAPYFLLYGLCFDVCATRGLRAAKSIYKTALKKSKCKGVNAGINHLRQHATSSVADLYDFCLSDIGGYLPSYPQSHQMEYVFFDKKLKIEVCFAYKSWLEIVEKEIKKRGFR